VVRGTELGKHDNAYTDAHTYSNADAHTNTTSTYTNSVSRKRTHISAARSLV
jgi:hypothetical protein